MNLSISMESLKNVFRFPFQDPNWQNKLLIGSLLGFGNMIIPIVPALPMLGYLARVLRSGASNEDPSRLPEWDDWGDLFVDGLRQFGVSFIAMLPASLVMVIGWLVYTFGVVSMSSAQNSYQAGEAVLPFLISLGIFFVSISVGMLLMLASAVVLPPAMAHVAVQRRFSAAFEFSKWWNILRANWLGFLVAIGIFFALYTVTMLAVQIMYMTIIFCCLLPLVLYPLSFYSALVLYRLAGQAYGEVAPSAAAGVDAAAQQHKEPTTGAETDTLPGSDLPDR